MIPHHSTYEEDDAPMGVTCAAGTIPLRLIPRVVHQIFINPQDGSGDGLSDGVRNQCAAWVNHHPSYEHRMWSLPEVFDLCRRVGRQDVADAIRACRLPAMQADIARLLIMQTFGGFWSDLKLYPLTPFLETLRNHQIVFAEHFENEGWHPGLPCSAFLAAAPGHAFFDTALSIALDAVAKREPHTFAVAGPSALESAIHAHFPNGPDAGYLLIPHTETWNKLFGVGGGSYNGADNALHWSKRQQNEPLYVDAPKAEAPQRVTRQEIIDGYRYLLGREPSEHEAEMWRFSQSIDRLREEFLNSDEFRVVMERIGFVRRDASE